MDHAQVLGHFRPDLVVEQSSAQSACPAVLIVLAGLAAGQIVCAVVGSVLVVVVAVVAVFARMRRSRPRAVALDFQLPVLACMPAVFVAIGPCRRSVVRSLACFCLYQEY